MSSSLSTSAAAAAAAATRRSATAARHSGTPPARRAAAAARPRARAAVSAAIAEGAAATGPAAPQIARADGIRTATAGAVAEAAAGTAAQIAADGPVAHARRADSATPHVSALPLHLLARARLPLRERVAPSRAAVLVGRGPVAIWRAAPMFRPVLPVAPCTDVGVARPDVRVPVEVVVVVDVDVVVTPAGAPAPAAAPRRADRDADAEGNRRRARHVARIIDGRIRIDRSTPYRVWVVGRHVYDFRTGLFDHNHLLVGDDLRLDGLLSRRLQGSLFLGFGAHALHRV